MHLFFTYLKINLLILSAGLAFLFLGNLIIDPEGRFLLVDIPRINHEKTEAMERKGGRAVKALALERGNYDTILLGSSHVETGINPHHPAFGTSRVYNAALGAANLYEIDHVFTFLRGLHQVKTIVLGLDFTFFSRTRVEANDFLDSRFAETSAWLSNLRYLASFQTLLSSLLTVQNNLRGQKALYTDRGLRDRARFFDSSQINHRDLFIKILTRNYLVNQISYGDFSYGPDLFKLLQSIIEQCRTDGIALYLFLPPSHARDLETLRVLGLYPVFEQWERDLVAVLAADATAHPQEKPIPLWDFMGYTSITTEDVPSAEERGKQMQWYWESSHFKKELGDLVLDRIFDYHEPGRVVPEDFGVQITTANIEAHLAWIREQQRRYHQTHPQEVAEVEYLTKITERFRAHPRDADGNTRTKR